MIEFPLYELPGGITRPMIAVVIEFQAVGALLDGLLDTGSDRTIFPRRERRRLASSYLDARMAIKTAGGVVIAYRLAEVVLNCASAGSLIRWKTRSHLPMPR